MKKIIKISLITLLIGIVFTGIGFAIRGFKPFGITFDNGKIEVVDGGTENTKLDKTNLDPFTSMDIQINVGDINIIPSDTFAIEYSLPSKDVSYEIVDSKLVVCTKDSVNRDMFNFGTSLESYINIYVPSNTVFNKLDLRADVGDINIDTVFCKDMDLISNVGDLTLTGCKVDGKTTVSVSTGDLKVTSSDVSTMDVTSSTGDVTMSGVAVSTSLNVKSDVGDVEVSLTKASYIVDITTDVGDIKVNGKEVDGGVSKSYKDGSSGPRITIQSDVGDVEIVY